jgi:hypothetical protein
VFVNRLPLHPLVALGIVLTGITVHRDPARASRTSLATGFTLQSLATHSLHLQDSSWSQVRVEVRVGPNATCEALGTLGVQVLEKGQEWAVQFDDPVICWRRDQTPGVAASGWAPWNRVQLAAGESRMVTL